MNLFKPLLLSFLLLLPLVAKATAQEPEIIYIDGEKWSLFNLLVEHEEHVSEKLQQALSKDELFNTGCYRKYIGEWELKNEKLYLRGIKMLNGDYLHADTLKNIFAPYYTNDGILASWVVAGGLRAGRGETLEYCDEWDGQTYEQECLFTIVNGVLTEKKIYDNFIKQGVSMDFIYDTLKKNFPWELFPGFSDELIHVEISDVVVDDDAVLVDCNVMIQMGLRCVTDQNDPRVVSVKEIILKNLSPWTCLHVNGRVQPYSYVMNVENRENTRRNIENRVNAIYREVETMIKNGNFDSSSLVKKYCTYIFRSIYSEAHGWAKKNNASVIDYCHWIRSKTYENPKFRVASVGAVTQEKDDFRKVIVFMEKSDTVDGKPVVQPFALRMVHAGNWKIEDFQNPHMPVDSRILKNNLSKAKQALQQK